jgi:antirestriction protein ArdC
MLGWKKLGYSVKGAKSKKIYFFKPNQKPIIENGRVKTNAKGEEEYYTTWTFKHYNVFKAEDVHSLKDNSPYPIPAVDNSHLDHNITPIENCKKFFDNLGAKIIHDGSKCFYRPSTDEIGMPDIKQFDNAEEYYSVLAHEHIHWSGSDTRLKRSKLNYAEEELVAELGAFLTSIHLGIQSSPKPNNLAYLKSWSKGEINKMKIFSALSDAHKGVNYLKEQQVKEVKKVA